MITTICGEDSVASRAYLSTLVEQYRTKEYEVQYVLPDQIEALLLEDAGAISLFGLKKLYVIENLNKTLKRKTSGALLEKVKNLSGVEVVSWEDGVGKRELKLQTVQIKEFKLPQNVFQMMDACYPHNLKKFLELLHEVMDGQNDIFLYIMLTRHIRNVLFVSLDSPPPALQSWQVGKLKKQAAEWDQTKLLDFYDRLIGLDFLLKTGKNAYSLGRSIEVLAVYFLK